MPDIRWYSFLAVVCSVNLAICMHYCSQCNNFLQRVIASLSLVYVAVCAFRACFPVKVVERVCFFDSSSSPMIDRSMATLAELCFILSICLFTYRFLDIAGCSQQYRKIVSLCIILIIIAQACCWVGSITTNQLWNALEESLWTASFILLIGVWAVGYHHIKGKSNPSVNYLRTIMPIAISAAVLYVSYMATCDVPMYIERWKNFKKKPVGFDRGLRDMMKCARVSKKYKTWTSDVPWRMFYFGGASWASISIICSYMHLDKLESLK